MQCAKHKIDQITIAVPTVKQTIYANIQEDARTVYGLMHREWHDSARQKKRATLHRDASLSLIVFG